MRIALFGHGVMGSLFRARAEQEGHEIGLVVTSWAGEHGVGSIRRALEGHDVAVDFSTPDAVLRNAEVCALADVPLVEGTTGWDDYFYAVRQVVRDLDGAFVFGSNFSMGANVFQSLVGRAAEIIAAIDAFYPSTAVYSSIRGTHWVGFDSESDGISMSHTSRSREEYASGALLAARWVIGRRGFFPYAEVVDDILSESEVGSRLAVSSRQ